MNITKETIRTLSRPQTGYVLHWDEKQRGFGLRITSAGAVSFIAQGRIGTKERRITLGRFPAVSPDLARKAARVELGDMQRGTDPVAAKQRDKLASKTLAAAFCEYAELRHRADGKALKDSTKADMDRSLRWGFDSWKSKPVTSITRDMVERRYQQLSLRSVARANLAMRYLRAVIGFTADRMTDSGGNSVLADNPVRVLRRQWKAVGRRQSVIDPAVLSDWRGAVMALGDVPARTIGQGKLHPKLRGGAVARDLLLFMALTGCRKGEALGLLKSDVQLRGEFLIFRDTKNRSDHRLPMTKEILKLVSGRMSESPSDFVFASPHDGRPISNLRYAIDRVVSASGVQFCPHDLRRLAATTMERIGIPGYTIKAVLNHATDAQDVTGGYVRVDDAMKLEALEKLGSFLMQKPSTRDEVGTYQGKVR